jgi:hypothetical protein
MKIYFAVVSFPAYSTFRFFKPVSGVWRANLCKGCGEQICVRGVESKPVCGAWKANLCKGCVEQICVRGVESKPVLRVCRANLCTGCGEQT